MKNTIQNSGSIFSDAKFGNSGVVSFSINNLPSIILLGIIILSLLGILITVVG